MQQATGNDGKRAHLPQGAHRPIAADKASIAPIGVHGIEHDTLRMNESFDEIFWARCMRAQDRTPSSMGWHLASESNHLNGIYPNYRKTAGGAALLRRAGPAAAASPYPLAFGKLLRCEQAHVQA